MNSAAGSEAPGFGAEIRADMDAWLEYHVASPILNGEAEALGPTVGKGQEHSRAIWPGRRTGE